MSDIPLRQRKHAKTKAALMRSLAQRLKEKPFDAISVRDLADDVQISEVTFYNYFPKKTDLLAYMTQMMLIKAHHECIGDGKKGIDAIYGFFDILSESIEEYPRIRNEAIAFFFKEAQAMGLKKIKKGELMILLGSDDIKDDFIRDTDIFMIFKQMIKQAVIDGDMPDDVDVGVASLLMISVLSGTPACFVVEQGAKKSFKRQIDIILRGLGCKKDV